MMDAYLNYLWFSTVVVALLTVLFGMLWLALWTINQGVGNNTWFKGIVSRSEKVCKVLVCIWVGTTLFTVILTMISDFLV